MKLNWKLGTAPFSLLPYRMEPPFGQAFAWFGLLVWFYVEEVEP